MRALGPVSDFRYHHERTLRPYRPGTNVWESRFFRALYISFAREAWSVVDEDRTRFSSTAHRLSRDLSDVRF